MEVPFLSLSKKRRFEPIEFKKGDTEIVVTGGKPYGIANIWDWDLIMWLLSQLRQALDKGEEPSRRMRFHRQDFLRESRRGDGGDQFRRLEETIERLANTNVFTSIRPGPGKKTVKFSWIEYAEMERDENGRISWVLVTLPEWLYAAICDSKRVLSVHPDYYLLTGGLERFLYRLIRKQAGHGEWKWKMRTLHERSGTTSQYKYWARDMRKLVGRGRLLDYDLFLERSENNEEMVRAVKRSATKKAAPVVSIETPPERISEPVSQRVTHWALRGVTYEKAKLAAPGYDVYALEVDWRRATERNGLEIRDPDGAFLAWCRQVHERNPIPAR